ncbi:hypothetical protein GCM10007907_20500 [Chitinimonas prasina]|uniref:Uncharacterized protein n=1 Tax=Chitinimonas prasina TaxID=1434937 RepID=A0ABQ5YE88_9NEIS|nr:hypothetical protein [Chitinimonas prasina]GLR13260.1 hypothetical protein GCM10007907_20500 [Chitinimonas prasina]
MKKFALVLLIVFVVAFAFVSLPNQPESAPVAEKVQATAAAQAEASGSGLFSQRTVDGGNVKPLDSKASSESLTGSLRDAQSYRQFILSAAQHPERGGIAYAKSISTTCLVIQKSQILPRTNDTGAPATAVSLAAALLKSRCDITRSEYDALRKSQAFVDGSKKDPLLALLDALDKAKGQDKALLVSKALESADPIVLSSNMLAWRKGTGSSDLPDGYFNGKWHTYEETEASGVEDAFRLARCDLGWDCGPNNPMTLGECALAGVCQDSLEKTLLSVQVPGRDWAKTQVLRRQIVEAVRTKNVGFFVPTS